MDEEYGGGFVAVTSDPDGEGYFAGVYGQTHCRHGVYVGYPGGPDYMCPYCEGGYEPEPFPTDDELVRRAYEKPPLSAPGMDVAAWEAAADKYGFRRIVHTDGRVAYYSGGSTYRFADHEEGSYATCST
jgi:hypothetical protein